MITTGCIQSFHSLLDQVREPIQRISRSGEVRYANPAWYDLVGYIDPPQAALEPFAGLHSTDRSRLDTTLTQLTTTRCPSLTVPFTTALFHCTGTAIAATAHITWDGCDAADPEFWIRWQPEPNPNSPPLDAADPTLVATVTQLRQDLAQRTRTDQENQRALREKEQVLRVILDNIPQQIFWKDTQSVFLGCNQVWAQQARVSDPQMVVGKTDYDLCVAREIAEAYRQQDQRVMTTGQPELHQIEHKRLPDGEQVWLDVSRIPIYGADGAVMGILGTIDNITDRKLAEEARRSSEEHRRLALDLTHIGSWDWQIATNELTWNDNHYTIMGLEPGTPVTYKRWQERVHPNDVAYAEAAVLDALRTRTDLDVEYRICHPDGSIRWVISRGRGMYGADGLPQRMVGVMIDISDRKRTELALQQQKDQLDLALVSANMGTWEWDLTTHRQIWSETLEVLSGFAPGEYDGSLESFYERLHPEDLPQVQALDQHSIKTGGLHQHEYRLMLPDGTIRWMGGRGLVYCDAGGKPVRIMGVSMDISDRKRTEAEILKALAKERELNELKSRFVAMVSHEVRTPLTTIMTSADVLQNIPCSDADRQDLFALIQASIRRMVQLLENSLAIGITESGNLGFAPTEFDLQDFCERLLQDLGKSIGWQHTLHLDWQLQATAVYLDPKLLQQILNNLLSNAIKYSEPGTPVILTVTQVDGDPDLDLCGPAHIQFQVQDQGIGIPPENQAQLFDCFYRASNVETIDGTGLGLSIVKNCLDCHGGHATFVSALGQGTTFTVSLPILPPARPDLPPDTADHLSPHPLIQQFPALL
jgi:PAS domain S-box-containing protein